MNRYPKSFASVSLLACLILAAPVNAAQRHSGKAEAQQTTENQTAQSRYQTAKKEANAAYKEALADCRKMRGAERTTCMKEAKANLQNDLAEAKKTMSSGE